MVKKSIIVGLGLSVFFLFSNLYAAKVPLPMSYCKDGALYFNGKKHDPSIKFINQTGQSLAGSKVFVDYYYGSRSEKNITQVVSFKKGQALSNICVADKNLSFYQDSMTTFIQSEGRPSYNCPPVGEGPSFQPFNPDGVTYKLVMGEHGVQCILSE